GLRMLTLLAALGVIAAMYALGRVCDRRVGGAIAGAIFVYLALGYKIGVPAANGEQILLPLVAWSSVSLAHAVRSEDAARKRRLSFIAGLLLGLAGWTKITFLVGIAPLALWSWISSDAGPDGSRARVRALVPLVLGWLAPGLFVLGVYGIAGAWDDLVYRFFTYNSDVYMAPYADASLARAILHWFDGPPHERPVALSWLVAMLALAGYLGFLLAALRRGELRRTLLRTDVVAITLALATLGFASGIAEMRFWNHHFAAAVPWVGLLAGLAVDELASRARPWLRTAVQVVALGACVVVLLETVGAKAWDRELERRRGAWERSSHEPLCKVIHRYAGPRDPIFVWGFDGDLYVSCAREPASRYVYTTLVAGIVPPFWHEPRSDRVARDAPRDTALDLEHAKPPLIVDVPDSIGGTSIHDIPELEAIVARDYCRRETATGWRGRKATFYGRRDRGWCDERR
ncbi:MAG TPA: hypothetical protein VHR17_10335, partial [Thermoanaerobaculia bacterium]|nr:hypothetical protein [Thermoanaerobaculia bacterium]